jgi:NADH-quinone oxidoreductase subunit L
MAISVAGALGGISAAAYIFLKRPSIAVNTVEKFKSVYNTLWNKYYVDEVYDVTVINPIVNYSRSFLWKIFDNKIIDGFVNGLARSVGDVSVLIRKMQTGIVQSYALVMMIGILLALFWIILSL